MKYKVIFTDDMPEWKGGYVKYPLFPLFGLGIPTVYLRNKYRSDLGILNHELKHIEQYNRLWCHAQLYTWSKSYRYKCELEAYTEQIKDYKYTKLIECDWIVEDLLKKYNLNKIFEQVQLDIIRILNKVVL